MRTIAISAIALAMSVSSYALAQGQGSGGQQTPQGGQETQQGRQETPQQNPTRNYEQSGQDSAQASPPSGKQQATTRSYKAVEDALKQAGIQNVQTLNAAYLVSATTKEGEEVSFVVDPPATGGTAAAGAQPGAAAEPQEATPQGSAGQMALVGQQQVIDDLKKAGFTNVQIVEAAYLATGQTKSNDQITMMIKPGAESGGQTATSD